MTRKPGVQRALRGFAEAGNGFGDALGGERDRHRIIRSKRDRAGRDHFAPSAPLLGDFCPAFPRTRGARFASGVRELNSRDAALRVNEFHGARQRLDVRFAPNAQILRADARLRQHACCFRHHQARAAHGAAAKVHQMPIVGEPVFAGVLAHGRDGDAIREGYVADLDLIEKPARIGVGWRRHSLGSWEHS